MSTFDKLYEKYMVDEMGFYMESEQEKEADRKLEQVLKRVLPGDIGNQDSNDLDDAIVDYVLASKRFGFQEGFKLAIGLVMECEEGRSDAVKSL